VFMMILFRSLKSVYDAKVLSLFFTYKTELLHSDTLSKIILSETAKLIESLFLQTLLGVISLRDLKLG